MAGGHPLALKTVEEDVQDVNDVGDIGLSLVGQGGVVKSSFATVSHMDHHG